MRSPTSSSPVAVTAAHEGEVSLFALVLQSLMQLFAAVRFDLGLCRSGRHHHKNRFIRANCCNGYRLSWSTLNGERTPKLRPITLADPRFSWEAPPSLLQEMHTSVNPRFVKRPGYMPGHDRPWQLPHLTAVERFTLEAG